MATKKKPVSAEDLSAHVARARTLLEQCDALKLSALAPANIRKQVAAQLAQEGFEVTKSVVRKPLAAQVAQALEHGALIALKGLAAHVVGAAEAETKRAALALVAQGQAKLVLRGKAVSLSSIDTAVLDGDTLRALGRELTALQKVVTTALKAKPNTGLLLSDVEQSLSQLLPASARTRAGAGNTKAEPAGDAPNRRRQVLRAVDMALDAKLGMAFVPRVIELLGLEGLSIDVAKAAILEAASREAIELRPEGGLNRLSTAELLLCLPGPQGTQLSWAKRA
jgi:hypothetical protein